MAMPSLHSPQVFLFVCFCFNNRVVSQELQDVIVKQIKDYLSNCDTIKQTLESSLHDIDVLNVLL